VGRNFEAGRSVAGTVPASLTMEQPPIVLPVPSLSGSSLMCLSDDLGRVFHDVTHALESLRDACPHRRDYPTPELWSAALDQHILRRTALESVQQSIQAEREGLARLDAERQARFTRKAR